MKTLKWLLSLAACCVLVNINIRAATNYVWQGSPRPEPPYTDWSSAAHTIQDAVDAASAGDTVLVTNGVYATGGRATGTNLLLNRVAVDKPITLQSVNGPEFTVIRGYEVPQTTNGDSAIRCVSLTGGAILTGFTLTNGLTRTSGDYNHERSGGGVWCESTNAVVSNCLITGNAAARFGGGAYGGTLNGCTLVGNSATYGGGAYRGSLNHCALIGNRSSFYGGGAYSAVLNNCTLASNSAASLGGGAAASTLNHCILTGNSATGGGGAYEGSLNACTLADNSAGGDGGGARSASVTNCTLTNNFASNSGGGSYGGTLRDCTLSGNRSDRRGGGAGFGTLYINRSIIYFTV